MQSLSDISRRHHRHILFTAIAAVMVLFAVIAACQRENSEDSQNLGQLLQNSPHALYKLGYKYYHENKPASAYLMYVASASLYTPSMTREDKLYCERSFNNAGLIAHFDLYDYPLACSHYLNAMAIAEEIDEHTVYPYVYMNIGNLMCATSDWDEGMKYQIKSMKAAVAISDTLNYLRSSANLFSEAMIRGRLNDYDSILHTWPQLKSSGELYNYTFKLYKAAMAIRANDRDAVSLWLNSIDNRHLDKIGEPDRLEFLRFYILAKYEEQCKRHRSALDVLESINTDSLHSPELRGYLYSALADNYKAIGNIPKAADYKLRYADLRDTLTSDGKQQSIYQMKEAYATRSLDFRMKSLLSEKRDLVKGIWTVSLFGVILLALLIVVAVSRRKLLHANRLIYERNSELLNELDLARQNRKRQASAITVPDISEDNNQPAPSAETVKSDEETLSRITELFEDSPEIFNPDFSIERMATMLSLPVKRVSKAINDGLGQNFSTTLQTYRIREACRRLSEPARSNLTIEAISDELGFRSRSNFNTVFKKITGLTPGSYQKFAREEKARPEVS